MQVFLKVLHERAKEKINMSNIIISNDLGPGKIFTIDGNLYTVLEQHCNKTAMRKMIVKAKVKDLRTGTITEMSFNGGDKVTLAYLEKEKKSFLYDDGSFCVFMDNDTYEQVNIPKERLTWELNFLTDNLEVIITSYINADGSKEIMGVELPVKVALKVVHTDDAVKGDTINKAVKDATLQTGYVVKVPMFIKNDEVVNIRTDTGEYDSRAN